MNILNNIKGIVLGLPAIALAIASCTNADDEPMVVLPNIGVADVTGTQLKAKGDTIVINLSRTASKVYATDPWVKIKQNGNSIQISAAANDSREKRNALVIMKDGDNDSTEVNVSQEGLIMKYSGDRVIVHSYNAKSKSVGITTNEAERIQIISQPSWITSYMDGDSLRMRVAENKNGTKVGPIRMGYVKFGINDVVDSVKVVQYYRTNLRGTDKWYLGGYLVTFDEYGNYSIDQSTTRWLPADLTFSLGNEGKFTFRDVPVFSGMDPLKFVLKATLDPNNMSFEIENGQFVSSVGDSIYIAETLIGAGFMRTFSTTPKARFVIDVDDSGNFYGRITGEFPYNGANLDIIGMWFCAFRQEEFSYDYYYGQGLGDLFGFTPCWLMMNNTDAMTTASFSKKWGN